MIGTPVYSEMCNVQFMCSVIELIDVFKQHNIDYSFVYLSNQGLVHMARNRLAHFFLLSDCTHLFFIDSDMQFDAQQALKMIYEDKDLIAGVAPMRKFNFENCFHKQSKDFMQFYVDGLFFNINTENKTPIEFGLDKLSTVNSVGTGFMCIHRNVFEKLIPVTAMYNGDENEPHLKFYNFFDTAIDDDLNILLSEDFYFCKQWKKIGGEIYVANYVLLNHIGSMTYGILS